jgi:hypothetical protein
MGLRGAGGSCTACLLAPSGSVNNSCACGVPNGVLYGSCCLCTNFWPVVVSYQLLVGHGGIGTHLRKLGYSG